MIILYLPIVLPQSAHCWFPAIPKMIFIASGTISDDTGCVAVLCMAVFWVVAAMGFFVLGLDCFSASSVVSCSAVTHVFICLSFIVWKRCSVEGVMTCTGL